MAVLGVVCNWTARRVSYAILDGTKNNPRKIDIIDLKLSEDVGVSSLDNLAEVGKKTVDICKNYPIQRACLFTPGGWEKSRAKEGWRPSPPMQYRIEGVTVDSLQHSGITEITVKLTERVASDFGIDRGSAMRERIRSYVENKIQVANDSQRDATAAALSILD